MQIGPNTTIPDEVLRAADDGALAFFVGAGVSMAPPSSLPDFDELARQVGATFQQPEPGRGEPADVYLGKLTEAGRPVHDRVEELVTPPTSEPNELHRLLVELSLHEGQPRIVTTNFDHHFETVAPQVMDEQLGVFRAPALPPGGDFKGLVYLHGKAHDRPYRVVVTDEDFGAAYLVDGWATRFLLDMFRKYVTVFVGYSHNDTVMSYLGRGLPPNSLRFALDRGSGGADEWNHRRIKVVPYALGSSPDDFSGLPDLLRLWKHNADLRYGDIAEHVKLLSETPPDADEEVWFLAERFSDPVVQSYFAQFARKPGWLRWAHQHDLIRELFDPHHPYSEQHSKLATWFRSFVWTEPHLALEILRHRGSSLSPTLWDHIARDIANAEWAGDTIPTAWKHVWLSVLLQSARPRFHQYDPLTSIAMRLDAHEEWTLLSLLLQDQLRPRVRLVRSFTSYFAEEQPRQVDFEIELTGEEYFLADVWDKKVRPVLRAHAPEMVDVLVGHIRLAAQLLRPMEIGNPGWHALHHEVDRLSDASLEEDRDNGRVLIVACRDAIDALHDVDPDRALAIARSWLDEDVLVLQRLGLYGLAGSDLPPDEKVAVVLDRGILTSYWLKTEVYHVLRAAAHASPAVRERLIAAVREAHAAAVDDDTDQYEAYNLSVWIKTVSPGDDTEGLFDELQAAHENFAPREDPDLEGRVRVTSSSAEWSKPAPVDPHFARLTDTGDDAVAARVDWVLAALADEITPTVMETIFEHAKQETDASLQLASALYEREIEEWLVWRSLIRGWTQSSLNAEMAKIALTCIRPLSSVADTWEEVTEFYRHLGKSQVLDEAGLQEAAEQVASLLHACESLDITPVLQEKDWLHASINHPGGRLAQAAVSYFHRARALELAPFDLPGLETLRDQIANADSITGQMARVIFYGNLGLFVHTAPEWSGTALLPAFTTEGDEQQKAWHGYLWMANPDAVLFQRMLPGYQALAETIDQEPDDIREHYCLHLARAAFFYSTALSDHWLDPFIATFSPELGKTFARQLDRLLRALDNDRTRAVWEEFLRDYWARRNAGTPKPLDDAESAAMAGWLDELHEVYAEAATLFMQSPTPNFEHAHELWQLAESEMVETDPDSVADVAHKFMLGSKHESLMCGQAEQLVTRLHQAGAAKAKLLLLCDDLAAWTCPGVVTLRQRINAT